MSVAGFTSTGSKHPDVFYGGDAAGLPARMVGSSGCMTRGDDGRDYLDFVMALGAVSLGYGHPAVTEAAIDAVKRGGIGALAPVEEELTASAIAAMMPHLEQVRFFKSGAEAVAAAVRLARVATGRDQVLGCGYHGWLDWCSDTGGVPAATRGDYGTIDFNDVQASLTRIREVGDRLSCVVIEPMILAEPQREWLDGLRTETERLGALLVFDEIKTGFRVAPGGAAERWGVTPDLTVLGKALANGFPLAAVGGSIRIMQNVQKTWMSSTTATEFVSLAAARATLQLVVNDRVPHHLAVVGQRLWDGLTTLTRRLSPEVGVMLRGMPQMCHLEIGDRLLSHALATGAAREGLLWKRGAYNFVSFAHDDRAVARALEIINGVLDEALRVRQGRH